MVGDLIKSVEQSSASGRLGQDGSTIFKTLVFIVVIVALAAFAFAFYSGSPEESAQPVTQPDSETSFVETETDNENTESKDTDTSTNTNLNSFWPYWPEISQGNVTVPPKSDPKEDEDNSDDDNEDVGMQVYSAISTGEDLSCAIADGKAYCWGANRYGQLGNGTTDNSNAPVAVATDGVLAGKTITSISADGAHACAIADGKVYCWGANWSGQLGNGTDDDSNVPVAVSTDGVLAGKTITSLSVGYEHTCVIADGKVYCWGSNWAGSLGDGSNDDSNVPVAVSTDGVLAGKTITSLSASSWGHVCVIADGDIYCWGYNSYGQLGNGTTDNSNAPVAVVSDGALNGKTVTEISTGGSHTCATADSNIYCWGWGHGGRLGNGTVDNSSVPGAVSTDGVLAGKTITAISAGESITCAIADGKVYCWGYNSNGQLGNGTDSDSSVPVAVVSDGALSGKTVTEISAGSTGFHVCVIADGKAYCWGNNAYGELGNGTNEASSVPTSIATDGILSNKTITSMSANYEHACAIADGKAYCWGNNAYGQLGNGTTDNSIVPMAVSADGVLSGKTITYISAGYQHTCAIADGKAYCWGWGLFGQLGNGSGSSSIPVAVATGGVLNGKAVTSISVGFYHTCAIADGKAYCWGRGLNGQLGNGVYGDSSIPVAVFADSILSGKTITYISVDYLHTCAIADGKAYCWGNNAYGQLGNGTTDNSSVPVAVFADGILSGKTITLVTVGYEHTCAIVDGKAYCWGRNADGQLGNGTTDNSSVPVAVFADGVLSGKIITSISSAQKHTCALSDGKAYCWGTAGGGGGQFGNGYTKESNLPLLVSPLPII